MQVMATAAADDPVGVDIVTSTAADAEWMRDVFDQSPASMALIGADLRLSLINAGFAQLFGYRAIPGATIRDLLPPAVAADHLALVQQARLSGRLVTAPATRCLLQLQADSTCVERCIDFAYRPLRDASGVLVLATDVTERVAADAALHDRGRRLRLLDQIGQVTRMAADPREILQSTTYLLGEHLGVARCTYADIEPEQDRFTIRHEWAAPGYPTIVGEYSLASFGHQAAAILERGESFVVDDVDAEPAMTATGRDLLKRLLTRALIWCPMIKGDGLRGIMAVHASNARHWSQSEIALVQAVAERSWAHLERVRAETLLRANEARYRAMAEKLSDSNRLKDEFLATLAHELRNPLAPIRNALELMNLAPDHQDVIASAREMMGRQLAQMVRLIDDLLDISRVSRGIVELRRSRMMLKTALEDAIETSRPLIEQAGHHLHVNLPDEPIELLADPTRIVQIFANLMNNAAKFTERGGSIELHADVLRDQQQVRIAVRDNGVGIAEGMLERVFDMFTQVDRSHTQIGGGLGIGLTLVRRLVDMHGGRVEARSKGPGTGSEFVVVLPLADPAHAEAPVATAPRRERPTIALQILVADDNVDAARSLSMMLDLIGHHASVANDGIQALDLARSLQPDVVILDIAMPGMNGYEVARQIRSATWGRGCLLIAASGWGHVEDRQRSLEAGFDHHLVKPIELGELDRLLREHGADQWVERW